MLHATSTGQDISIVCLVHWYGTQPASLKITAYRYSIHKFSGTLLSLELLEHLKMDGSWPDWQKQKSCQCGAEL
jgi:hypothetical protein